MSLQESREHERGYRRRMLLETSVHHGEDHKEGNCNEFAGNGDAVQYDP